MSTDRPSILFITQHFPPETGAGPTRVNELCSRWSRNGHDVTVVTSAPDYPEGKLYDGYENEWLQREDHGGVSVVMTKTIPASSGGLARRALKFAWFMVLSLVVGLRLPRHDVVIATSPQPLTGVSAWIIARLKGSMFVFEVRDLWPESITSLTDTNDFVLRPLGVLIRFTYRRADRVVTVSRAFEPDLVAAGVDPASIWYYPNGVTPAVFDRDDDDEFQIANSLVAELTDEFVVSYIGTMGRAHGLSVVLDAAEQLGDEVTFLFVGTGAEARDLESGARKRGLHNVRFVGRRPKEQVPEFMALSDVSLVHLRDVDLFRTVIPSKIFESMAAELPIALGVMGEAKQIVDDAHAGLSFEPENVAELVSTVETLAGDPDLRARLGANGRAFVSEHHTWDALAGKYSDDLAVLTTATDQ